MRQWVLVVLAVLACVSPAQAWDWNIEQLTDDAFNDYFPRVSGNNVVWSTVDGSDLEISWYNGTGISRLTDNDVNDGYADVGGNLVTWLSGTDTIYASTGAGLLTLRGGNASMVTELQASGGNAFWLEENDKVYRYDGSGVQQIASGGFATAIGLDSDGDRAVWRSVSGDVFYYNGSSVTGVANQGAFAYDQDPRIYGDTMAWIKDNNIVLYNITSGSLSNITNNPSITRTNLALSGNVVAWGENGVLTYYNRTSGTQSNTSSIDVRGTRIAGDLVVGFNKAKNTTDVAEDLLLFDGNEVMTLVNGTGSLSVNQFDTDGNKIVWDFYKSGGQLSSREIFTATVVPEPLSAVLFVLGGAVLAGRSRRKRNKGI